jgi:hypothetical protein
MSRRLVAVAALTLGLMVATAAPALAQEVIPGGGNAFGQHVAGMAPEHAIQHGAEFGACISAMARGLDCPTITISRLRPLAPGAHQREVGQAVGPRPIALPAACAQQLPGRPWSPGQHR